MGLEETLQATWALVQDSQTSKMRMGLRSALWLTVAFLVGTSRGVTMGQYPSIYPELQRMAREKEWVTAWTENSQESHSLVLLHFDPTRQSVIYDLKVPRKELGMPILSPRGRQVACWIGDTSVFKSEGDLLIVDVTGEHPREVLYVAERGSLAWSPDEQKIAFLGHASEAEYQESLNNWEWQPLQPLRPVSLYVLDLQTKRVERLVKDDVIELTSQAWSPNGQQIAYMSVDRQVCIFDLQHQVVRRVAAGGDPTFAPTGDKIAYAKLGSNDYYLISADGSYEELFLKNNKPTFRYSPVMGPLLWSPDGRFVLYERTRSLSELPTPFVMDVQTKQEERLPQGSCVVASFGGRP